MVRSLIQYPCMVYKESRDPCHALRRLRRGVRRARRAMMPQTAAHRHDHGSHHGHGAGQDTEDLVTDPVCGMQVDPAQSTRQVEHEGQVFHFCSDTCQRKFRADPARYLASPPTPLPPPALGAIYTCPMHPEIRQVGPGNCPICGMALEPLEVTAEAGPNPELLDMTRRFWIGLVLTIPVVVLEMGGHIPSLCLHHLVPLWLANW